MRSKSILTVGYSTHEWQEFISLLRGAGITAIADVRSHPQARLPQYRREQLESGLKTEGIAYVFLGNHLGARRVESECYIGDRADYELVAKLPAFLEGLNRLERGAAEYRIALMCAEKEPLHCHRGVLIARALVEADWEVGHLLADGTVESHAETEQRMIDWMGVDPLLDSGTPRKELLNRAYRELGLEVSYHRPADQEV